MKEIAGAKAVLTKDSLLKADAILLSAKQKLADLRTSQNTNKKVSLSRGSDQDKKRRRVYTDLCNLVALMTAYIMHVRKVEKVEKTMELHELDLLLVCVDVLETYTGGGKNIRTAHPTNYEKLTNTGTNDDTAQFAIFKTPFQGLQEHEAMLNILDDNATNAELGALFSYVISSKLPTKLPTNSSLGTVEVPAFPDDLLDLRVPGQRSGPPPPRGPRGGSPPPAAARSARVALARPRRPA